MRHLDLFSGIGGFALAAQTVWGEEYENVGFCDNNPFCQKILKKHWPKATIYEDVRSLNLRRGTVDLVTGGFPCQPFSLAGKRRGKTDDRDLWPEMFRIIEEVRPAWVVGENVAGFVKMELERSVSDLESIGYDVQPLIIPACAVDAPHRRSRVWIIAHAASDGEQSVSVFAAEGWNPKKGAHTDRGGTTLADTNGVRSVWRKGEDPFGKTKDLKIGRKARSPSLRHLRSWPIEPGVGRVAHGVPHRVDRVRALGNAIVPQVAAEIFKAILCVNGVRN